MRRIIALAGPAHLAEELHYTIMLIQMRKQRDARPRAGRHRRLAPAAFIDLTEEDTPQ